MCKCRCHLTPSLLPTVPIVAPKLVRRNLDRKLIAAIIEMHFGQNVRVVDIARTLCVKY